MSRPAARQGDSTAHGGVITSGCPTVLIGGQPAARLGDAGGIHSDGRGPCDDDFRGDWPALGPIEGNHALSVEKGRELLFLPAYSPNLNIIERLWKLVKTKCLRNKYFPKFEDFRHALDSFLDALNTEHQDELESLLTLKFQFFPNHNS